MLINFFHKNFFFPSYVLLEVVELWTFGMSVFGYILKFPADMKRNYFASLIFFFRRKFFGYFFFPLYVLKVVEIMVPANDLFELKFPFRISSGSPSSFGSRLGAVFSEEHRGIVCLDLRHANEGKARCTGFIPFFEPLGAPVLAISSSLLAVGGGNLPGIKIIDVYTGQEMHALEFAAGTFFRSRSPACADWFSEDSLLAMGTRAGSVQLWDMRSSEKEKPATHLPPLVQLECCVLKLARDQKILASCHGDAVVVWDLRQLKMPVRQIVAPGKWKGAPQVTGLDWMTSSDFILSTGDSVFRVNYLENSADFLVACANESPVCAVPGIGGDPLIAFLPETGRVNLIDPLRASKNSILESFQVPACSQIYFLPDASRSILCLGEESLVLKSVWNHTGSWTTHALASSIEPSSPAPPSREENSGQTVFLERLARKIRRLYMEAAVVELGGSSYALEITVPLPENAKVKILFSMSSQWPNISKELWYVGCVPVPDLEGRFLDFSDLSDPVQVVNSLKNLRNALISEEISTEDISISQIPFPATCGVCWSPRGDMYRFHSLKGLAPWPKHREKLTMSNFLKLKQELDVIFTTSNLVAPAEPHLGSEAAHTVAVKLNAFSTYTEPVGNISSPEQEEEEEEKLDSEFGQKVFADQCMQSLPAAVFELAVDDHWFASVAPAVKFSSLPITAVESVIKVCRSDASQLVRETFELVREILTNIEPDERTGLNHVLTSIIEERIKTLYKKEESQAVAVLAISLAKYLPFFQDKEFSRSIKLLIHDHAGLFQRLQCFVSSRVLEKFNSSSFPLLADREQKNIFMTNKNDTTFCSGCDLPVRGLGHFCPSCGHGGHLNHIRLQGGICSKSNCGCPCVDPHSNLFK